MGYDTILYEEEFSLRSIDSWLDRFCRKHPRLGIPNLIKIIIVGTVLVYLLDMFGGMPISSLLGFSFGAIRQGQVWRLVTFIFLPETANPFFFALSLYFFWFVGSTLEREWGVTKFTVFYLMGILLNLLTGVIAGLLLGDAYVGMLYVNLSLFFAFASLYPDMRFYIFFILPVKAKWLAWFDAAIFAWAVLSSLFTLNWMGALLPIVAILNYLLFFWSFLAEFVRYRVRRAKHQTSRQTVNFRQATRKAQEKKGYLHKCAVCGKTDTDYPNEEFRYCSKCNGYYCYCTEHIGNHTHIE